MKMLKQLFSNEFRKGALILFITLNIFNFLNLLFHFIMGRMLGPADYGILAALMSLIFLHGIPSESVQNLVSRYTSKFNVKKENGKIRYLMSRAISKGIFIVIVLYAFLLIISLFLANFLDISFWLIALTNLMIFAAILAPILRGILQGRKKFTKLGISYIIEAIVKIIVAIFLVGIGFQLGSNFQIYGAMTGVLVGAFVALLFSLYFNIDLNKQKIKRTHFENVYTESVHYIIAMIVILLAFNIDILLAKRFFEAELAGKYAVLTILGRIIYLGVFSISKAMFPITSEKYEINSNTKSLFIKSLAVVVTLCIIGVMVYALFPKLIIFILYGSLYTDVSNLLVYSGIALSFLALTNVVLLYCLSINGLKKSYYLFIFLIIEIVLLSLFHDSLLEYILAFMASTIIMFIGTLFLLRKNGEKN